MSPQPLEKMTLIHSVGWKRYTSDFVYKEGVHVDSGEYGYTFLYPTDWQISNYINEDGCNISEIISESSTRLVITELCKGSLSNSIVIPDSSIFITKEDHVGQDGHTSHTIRASKTQAPNEYWYGQAGTEYGEAPLTNKDLISNTFVLYPMWFDIQLITPEFLDAQQKKNELNNTDNIILSMKVITG